MPLFRDDPEVQIIGESTATAELNREVDCAARSDAKVLITGETGAGKEVVARQIHHRSRRAAKGLVTLNCAGLPDDLLESELFGHARGSFTGAYRDKIGLLASVPGGTVFLDEIGEMSPRMQAALLRFLESGEIQRVGAERAIRGVDVRVIAATNRDLRAEIAGGTFREDLFFRLSVVQLRVPPLRERASDVPLLVDHYLRRFSRANRLALPDVTADAMDRLCRHAWPGNVRQLNSAVERMLLRSQGGRITAGDLGDELTASIAPVAASIPPASPRREPRAPDRVNTLVASMVESGDSFWSVVYPSFMARDLTREEVRQIVGRGLEATHGSYRQLIGYFNMPPEHYKRFLAFLRQYDCHLSFQPYRTIRPAPSAVPAGVVVPQEAPQAQFFKSSVP